MARGHVGRGECIAWRADAELLEAIRCAAGLTVTEFKPRRHEWCLRFEPSALAATSSPSPPRKAPRTAAATWHMVKRRVATRPPPTPRNSFRRDSPRVRFDAASGVTTPLNASAAAHQPQEENVSGRAAPGGAADDLDVGQLAQLLVADFVDRGWLSGGHGASRRQQMGMSAASNASQAGCGSVLRTVLCDTRPSTRPSSASASGAMGAKDRPPAAAPVGSIAHGGHIRVSSAHAHRPPPLHASSPSHPYYTSPSCYKPHPSHHFPSPPTRHSPHRPRGLALSLPPRRPTANFGCPPQLQSTHRLMQPPLMQPPPGQVSSPRDVASWAGRISRVPQSHHPGMRLFASSTPPVRQSGVVMRTPGESPSLRARIMLTPPPTVPGATFAEEGQSGASMLDDPKEARAFAEWLSAWRSSKEKRTAFLQGVGARVESMESAAAAAALGGSQMA